MNSKSEQETTREYPKEIFTGNRNTSINEKEEREVEEMLRAIEREHRSVVVGAKDGGGIEKLIIDHDPFPYRYVEHKALGKLKKLGEDTEEPKIKLRPGRFGWEVTNSGYSELVHLLPDLVTYRVPHFSYDEFLEAFNDELKRVGVIENETFGTNFHHYSRTWIPDGARHPLEEVLRCVQKRLRSKEFKSKLYSRKAKAKRIEKAFLKMFRRCLQLRSRILILRLDLIYLLKDEIPGMHPLHSDLFPNEYAMEAFIRDKDRFINNVRDKAREGGPLEHLLEWGWKQECGEKRGWHLHCVFILDASKVKSYWFYAMQLAELWERLTDGRGSGHICRKGDRSYRSNCLGEVCRGDSEAEKGFGYLARYFSLDDQMPVVLPSKKSQNYGITRIRAAERWRSLLRKKAEPRAAAVDADGEGASGGNWAVARSKVEHVQEN